MKKTEQRERLKAIRRNMSLEEISQKSKDITTNFCSLPEFRAAENVFIYISLPKEATTEGIIQKCHRLGKRVLVPVTEGGRISLCTLEADAELCTGSFGISEPKKKKPWQGRIDVAVIPGLGFDVTGGRMGFGKGCYDGFLAENPTVKIGLAFEAQTKEKIITEAHDVPMDIIVTEKGVLRI